jgi:glyoxylase-like metal-dependent hydrolase (beta-lactamase superfamily II)
MRKIASGVYFEDKYAGVNVGLVVSHDDLFLVDCPLKPDDTKDWIAVVSERGRIRYLALLDAHPDRVLGARQVDAPLLAQDDALTEIREWSDTFKGGNHPIGSESDYQKRITGIHKAIPELSFHRSMQVMLGSRQIDLVHRPGPDAGSIWVMVPDCGIAFIGDCVTLTEPPYLGSADLSAWQSNLDELRGSAMKAYTPVSAYGGPVEREDINAMARYLRKVETRIEKLEAMKNPEREALNFADELISDFPVPPGKEALIRIRLQAGLLDLVERRAAGDI